jgi:DNA-binding CsgD family transcriptional regulator
MTRLPLSNVSLEPTRRARILSKHPSSAGSIGQPLTERESEVLWLVTKGLSNKSIAARLDLSAHTVKFHIRNAARKSGTSSRTKAAVDFALQQGTVSARRKDAEGDTEKQNWINGFAVALAQVHRHGGGSTIIYETARTAGLTLAVARDAGVSAFDIEELNRAKVP